MKLGAGHLALTPARVGPAARARRRDPRPAVRSLRRRRPGRPRAQGAARARRGRLPARRDRGAGARAGRVRRRARHRQRPRQRRRRPGQPLALDVLLPELWLSVARAIEGANGETTVQRVRVEAARPLHVSVNGDHVVLDEAHFETDGGDLVVAGGWTEGDLGQPVRPPGPGAAAAVPGRGQPVEQLHRRPAGASCRRGGTLDKPDLRGEVAIANPVRLRPKDFDRDIVIGSGKFALDRAASRCRTWRSPSTASTMRARAARHAGPGVRPREHPGRRRRRRQRAPARVRRARRGEDARARPTCARSCAAP